MIKTLSPYYLTIPLTNPNTSVVCNSFTLKLFIWNGNKTAVPANAEYEKTIINASGSNGAHKLDISKLVNDFIDFSCVQSIVTALENGNNQVWVKSEIYYDDQPNLPQIQSIDLALKGYSYFLDGENAQPPTNKILLSGDEFKVNRNGFFVLPIITEEPTPEPPVINITNIELIAGIYYISFNYTGSYGVFNLSYNESGGDSFLEDIGVISPEIFEIILSGTTIFVRLTGFDLNTGQTIYSNIYEYIVP